MREGNIMFQKFGKRFKLLIMGHSFLALAAFALNPIHESSYAVLPRGKMNSDITLGSGFYFNSPDHTPIGVPLSLAFALSNHLEIGFGLKTAWVDAGDNVPYMLVGAKYLTGNQLSLGADLILGTHTHSQKGLTLNFHKRIGYTSRFNARFTGKLGFMDYNVNSDALTAFELAYYPTLRLMNPISFQFGFIGSSQSNHFEKNLAIDLQPGLIVELGHESAVESLFAFGLAGDHKEDLRIKVAFVKGF